MTCSRRRAAPPAHIRPFPQRYREALADARLPNNLLAFQRAWRLTRDAAFERLTRETRPSSWTTARAQLIAAKNRMLADPPAARRQFVEAARSQGAMVHEVDSADQARETILQILRDGGVKLLATGKSMVAEEIFLNHHLEAAGLSVVETDLGEWIIQLAHETPSHMVMPAIHKSRQQIAALFESVTHQPVPRDDVGAQMRLARDELRRVFLSADAGMIGANALIAETGSVMLVTNEGNGDLVSTLPRLLIVIAGWEKIVPAFADAVAQVRLLARSGTGQEITTYTSFINGPEPGHELHAVLVDNGRTAMWADPAAREALRCIRCAACADVCPPYQVVGGQVFGYVYSGAIGLVNTPFHHGLEANSGPQSLCVSCNACATVCPVEIPLPQLTLDARARVVEANGLPWYKRAASEVWARPPLFDALFRLASRAQRPLLKPGRRPLLSLPASDWRTTPGLAPRPARDVCLARQTIENLEAARADYVVTGAASCAIAIEHDFPRLLRGQPRWHARAEQLAARTLDLLTFVDRVGDPPQLARLDSPSVTYHSFCQSTNVLGIAALGPRLLQRAGVQVVDLAEMEVCCGFGGGASIDHPEVARGIVSRELDNVRATGAAVLCSDNPGCILHLRGAADAARLALEVKHVAEVLAEALLPRVSS